MRPVWGENTRTGRLCIDCGGDIHIVPGGGSVEFQMAAIRCVACAQASAAAASAAACEGYRAREERRRLARLRADGVQ